jgi:hypothetical protein
VPFLMMLPIHGARSAVKQRDQFEALDDGRLHGRLEPRWQLRQYAQAELASDTGTLGIARPTPQHRGKQASLPVIARSDRPECVADDGFLVVHVVGIMIQLFRSSGSANRTTRCARLWWRS